MNDLFRPSYTLVWSYWLYFHGINLENISQSVNVDIILTICLRTGQEHMMEGSLRSSLSVKEERGFGITLNWRLHRYLQFLRKLKNPILNVIQNSRWHLAPKWGEEIKCSKCTYLSSLVYMTSYYQCIHRAAIGSWICSNVCAPGLRACR